MNIPENILQQVADAAFLFPAEPSFTADPEGHPLRWQEQGQARRAVIQHAISNPVLAPFLAEADAKAATIAKLKADLSVFQSDLNAELAKIKAEATPPAEPEPAAQVPLGPEDMKPDAWIQANGGYAKVRTWGPDGVCLDQVQSPWTIYSWEELHNQGALVNFSIPDTGRWDANAWRPCSKPGEEVAK